MENKRICIVAIVRHEESFLDEWICYHKLLGFEFFYLYDDDPELPLRALVEAYNFVTVIPWHNKHQMYVGRNRQTKAYHHALTNHLQGYEWVCYLDIDEFVVLREHASIQEFLDGFPSVGQVSLNWHVFGHNGFYEDPDGLVTHRLTRRKFLPSKNTKSIARVEAIRDVGSPHCCGLFEGWLTLDANHQFFSDKVYEGKTNLAHINHYQCRSFLRWMKRVGRGSCDIEQNEPVERKDHWRVDEEACLKQFVRTVALDKNEHVDPYMKKYTLGIIREIIDHKHWRSYPAVQLFNDKGTRLQNAFHETPFEHKLLAIAQKIIAINVSNSELTIEEKARSAVFLFYYWKFTNTQHYFLFAERLLESLIEQERDSLEGYKSRRLATLGKIVLHLQRQNLSRIETRDFLHHLDLILFTRLATQSGNFVKSVPQQYYIGGYFASRLHHLQEPLKSTSLARRAVTELLTRLSNADFIVSNDLSAVEFLTEISRADKKLLTKTHLHFVQQRVAQIESGLKKKNFFASQSAAASCALILLRAYDAIGIKKCFDIGNTIVNLIHFFETDTKKAELQIAHGECPEAGIGLELSTYLHNKSIRDKSTALLASYKVPLLKRKPGGRGTISPLITELADLGIDMLVASGIIEAMHLNPIMKSIKSGVYKAKKVV